MRKNRVNARVVGGWLWFGILVSLAGIAQSQVVIDRVVYWPNSSESVGEAVQLRNLGESSVNISGYKLATKSSAADAIIPKNTVLLPNQSFLVADINFSQAKDSFWKGADHEEAITLVNSDGGLQVVDSQGALVDAVGWGSEEVVGEFMEGLPAVPVPQKGFMLRRISNTHNNRGDFVAQPAMFESDESIPMVLTNLAPEELVVEVLDDNPSLPGVQLRPATGVSRIVHVRIGRPQASVSFNGHELEVVTMGEESVANLVLASDTPPGNYVVSANAGGMSAQIGIEVLATKALLTQSNSLALVSGESTVVRVRNGGNVASRVIVRASDLSGAQEVLSVQNVLFSVDGDAFLPLDKVGQDVGVSVEPNEELEIRLMLVQGLFVEPGTYGGFFVVASK